MTQSFSKPCGPSMRARKISPMPPIESGINSVYRPNGVGRNGRSRLEVVGCCTTGRMLAQVGPRPPTPLQHGLQLAFLAAHFDPLLLEVIFLLFLLEATLGDVVLVVALQGAQHEVGAVGLLDVAGR